MFMICLCKEKKRDRKAERVNYKPAAPKGAAA
jgi:hypothetical protein